jgi:hypothetical protein
VPSGGKQRQWQDGIKRSWQTRDDKVCFVNPPYSETERWLEKGVREFSERGVESVLLVPARLWRHFNFKLVYPNATELRVINGGLRFKGYRTASPMGSMLVIFSPRRSHHKRPRVTRAGQFEFFHIYL